MDSQNISATVMAPARPVLRDRKGFVYEPAIGPRLKVLLFAIFGSVAVLGATGAYLGSISLLEQARPLKDATYSSGFSLWVLLIHVAVGLLISVP